MNKGLMELVAAQQRNLDALLDLSKTILEELIKGGGGERIDLILAERSAVLDEAGKLDSRLAAVVQENGRAPGPAFEKLGRTVEEIVRTESECAAAMNGKKAEVAERLRSLGRGGEALRGYGGSGPGSRFVDIKK
ncbi:MAG: hypothetical protein HY098_09285 [Nitrospinae bacterium]|nr:hypothetical protein [Nitrospinota bacterium]